MCLCMNQTIGLQLLRIFIHSHYAPSCHQEINSKSTFTNYRPWPETAATIRNGSGNGGKATQKQQQHQQQQEAEEAESAGAGASS
mmetsp:Transcript_25841/g.49505  ORF Transcript_25841/g.49505 Transcript_25841/m.49505 type:complete len:85 (+) Transcript_25841:292-546(+)